MTTAFALSSHQVALDLYSLLNDLDPSRWRDESERVVREKLEKVQKHIETLLTQSKSNYAEQMTSVRNRLDEVLGILKEHMPQTNFTVNAHGRKQQWNHFRQELSEAYESLADRLRQYSFYPPSLRPTNYSRTLFHMGVATATLLLSYFLIPTVKWIFVIGPLTAVAWGVEFWRRQSPKANDVLLNALGAIGHPQERFKVNSATWYMTALVVLAFAEVPIECHVGLVVLGFADPAAGFFGRRWGKTKITENRTVLGTFAFWIVGMIASVVLFLLFYPELLWTNAIVVSAVASLFGAIAEVLSKKVDDNFSIPLAAALGAGLVMYLIG